MRPLRLAVSGTIRRLSSSVPSSFALALTGILLLVPAAVAGADEDLVEDATYRAEIRRTAHGIPHVLAADYRDLGFGSGYAAAEDNLCGIAEEYLTLSGERSRFFGADGTYLVFNQPITNADSDFFYRSLAQGPSWKTCWRKAPRILRRDRPRMPAHSWTATPRVTTRSCVSWKPGSRRRLSALVIPGCGRSVRSMSGVACTGSQR